jgi:hypothetical protein
VQVIMCPWHRANTEHPGGAPLCTPSGDLTLGNVIPLAELVSWQALATAEMMLVLNAIWFGTQQGEDQPPEEEVVEAEVVEGEPV